MTIGLVASGASAKRLRTDRRPCGHIALLSAVSLLSIAAGSACGQVLTQPAPVYQHVDGNSVDVSSGALSFSRTDVSIGPSAGGLTYTLAFYRNGWTSNLNSVALGLVSGGVIVSTGTKSLAFSGSGNNYTDSQALGNNLNYAGAGQYTLSLRDGSVYNFGDPQFPTSNGRLIQSIANPTGYVTNFSYNYLQKGGGVYAAILNAVTTNNGFMLSVSGAAVVTAQLPTQVTGLNLSQCTPPGTGCAAAATANYNLSAGGLLLNATDSAGRQTTYTYDSLNRLTQIRSPAGAVTTITYGGTTTYVASVSNGAGTWNYSYAVSGSTMTTTVADPNGQTRVVQVNTTNNTIISDTNALNQTTSYQYDSFGRPTGVTSPEGDMVQYSYDGRGNVLVSTHVAKPGSGLGNIVSTASYDATCVYAVKCNQPNATLDARGNETDYAYDTTYGSLLTMTAPATASGVRPQARFGYTPTYAYYYNTAGALAAGRRRSTF